MRIFIALHCTAGVANVFIQIPESAKNGKSERGGKTIKSG